MPAFRARNAGASLRQVAEQQQGAGRGAGDGQHLAAAAHGYHHGRGVYLSGLPYSPANSRFLERVLLWLGGRDAGAEPWVSDQPDVELAWYPETGKLALVNNAADPRTVRFHTPDGATRQVELSGDEWRWESMAF